MNQGIQRTGGAWMMNSAAFALCICSSFAVYGNPQKAKQEAIAHWDELSTRDKIAISAFATDTEAKVFFGDGNKKEVFKARWRSDRAPSDRYEVRAARLQ